MQILLDTNILIRLSNANDEQHGSVVSMLGKLSARRDEICIVPQNLYEYWAVATRPIAVNGLGLIVPQVFSEVMRFQSVFNFLPDSPEVFDTWLYLVTRHLVSGRPSHDARLAATVLSHGLDGLLTLNAPDFKRFDVKVFTPADFSPGGPFS